MNLEHKIMDKLVDDMAREMDYDIIIDCLGWTRVELLPFSSRYNAVDIADWCTNNCTGEFKNFGVRFAFEKSCDAEWFILKWK